MEIIPRLDSLASFWLFRVYVWIRFKADINNLQLPVNQVYLSYNSLRKCLKNPSLRLVYVWASTS